MDRLRALLAVIATVSTVGIAALPTTNHPATPDRDAVITSSASWETDVIIGALDSGSLPGADQLEMAGLWEWLMQLLPIHPDCISLSVDAPPCEGGQPVNLAGVSAPTSGVRTLDAAF